MIIAVVSAKGGVSKTTTAVSVAARLASREQNTLLLDFDPQGHCAITLGMDPASGVFDWLVGEQPVFNCVRMTRILHLDLLPGDSRTKTVDLVYRAEPEPHARIVQAIGAVALDHDRHIVIDTAAAGLLQEAAIAAADVLVCPVRLEHLGMDGLSATIALQGRLNSKARMIVLPTQFDARLNEHKYNLGVLHDNIPAGFTVAAPIPARVAVSEAVSYGRTVWEYESEGIKDVRTAYSWLVEMIVEVNDG